MKRKEPIMVPVSNLKIGDEIMLGNKIVDIEKMPNNLIKLHCDKNRTSFVVRKDSKMLVFNR